MTDPLADLKSADELELPALLLECIDNLGNNQASLKLNKHKLAEYTLECIEL